jgi:hypothetical protein
VYAVATDLTVLFCVDPLTPGRVDPYFADQARSVRESGGTVALIDHDALLAGQPDQAVRRVPRDSGPVWYRGWMIPADDYAQLANALARRGVALRVPPEQYRAAHELPGWYDAFATVTPASVWVPWRPSVAPVPADIAGLIKPLAAQGGGPAMVKDYVKSRKHEWAQACFIEDLGDIEGATRIIARMVELQEDSLNGGIVVRRFERYQQRDGRTVEARVWWLDGTPTLVGAHPDTPGHTPQPELTTVAPLVVRLGCRFVTTDLALRDDGVWRVVEVGDAQVSDLPVGIDPVLLFAPLAAVG